jgi:hypothetical protein
MKINICFNKSLKKNLFLLHKNLLDTYLKPKAHSEKINIKSYLYFEKPTFTL